MSSSSFRSLDGKTYTTDEEVSAADAAHFRAQGYRPIGEVLQETRDVLQHSLDPMWLFTAGQAEVCQEIITLYGTGEDQALLDRVLSIHAKRLAHRARQAEASGR